MSSSDDDPGSQASLEILLAPESLYLLAIILILLAFSALVSGAEVAFFSLKGEKKDQLLESKHPVDGLIYKLLLKPRVLLATILILNNLVNIAIVLISTVITSKLNFSNQVLGFVIQVVLVTFALVLLGEVIPKVYASYLNLSFSRFAAYPIFVFRQLLALPASLLAKSTSVIEKRISSKGLQLSVDELRQAVEITSGEETTKEEQKILEGILNFSNTTVKQVMRARIDITAFDINESFADIVQHINEHRFSRIPIYEETLDHIKGILYAKDLLPYIQEEEFNWVSLIRSAYMIPESKKIDDLLKEFQRKKVHMALVVDEYGGTQGLITMEDILEEIVGEINDEFDDAEIFYSRIDINTYVFDGKTSLSDLTKILSLDNEFFEEFKAEVESLGGLVVEIAGCIPEIKETVSYKNFTFTIESADSKRVKRVKVHRDKAEYEEG